MEINITLPDWADEREVTIFAGVEKIAFKSPTDTTWKVKTTRCSNCGKCCMDTPPNGDPCIQLKRDGDKYFCKIAANRPFACLVGEVIIPECSIRYEDQ